MKKWIILILVAVLVLSNVAYAEPDYSSMTAEELQAVIDQARLALTQYHPLVVDGVVLYEDENVCMTYTGIELDEYGDLVLSVVLENYTDQNLTIALNNVSCNGWAIWEGYANVPANKKAKERISFMSAGEDAELSSGEEVQDIEADLHYYDDDTWENIIEPVHVTWSF